MAPQRFNFRGSVTRFTKFEGKKKGSVILQQYFDKRGFDIHQMRDNYRLTVINQEALFKDFGKYVRPRPDMQAEVLFSLDKAYEWLFQSFKDVMYDSHFMTALEVCEYIDGTKSATYPWVFLAPKKSDIIRDSRFWLYFQMYWDALGTFEPLEAMWAVSPKEEIRPGMKLNENKIRSFIVGSLEHLIASYMFCLDQNLRFYSCFSTHGHSLGRSPFHGDWHKLIAGFDGLGCFSEDVSKMDSSIYRIMKEKIRDVRWRWMAGNIRNDQNLHRKFNELYRQSQQSIVVMSEGTIGDKDDGQNSGDGNTGTDNTFNKKAVGYASWIFKNKRWDIPAFKEYKANIKEDDTGDDTLTGIVPGYPYGPQDKQNFYDALGWEVELPPPNDPLKPAAECVYLSQTSGLFLNHYVPMPNASKILSSVLFGVKQDEPPFLFVILYSAKLLCFWIPTVRKEIDRALSYLLSLREHSSPAKWALALSVVKDDDQILALYFGFPEFSVFSSGEQEQCRHNLEAALNISSVDLNTLIKLTGLTESQIVFLRTNNETEMNEKSSNGTPKGVKRLENKIEHKVVNDVKKQLGSPKATILPKRNRQKREPKVANIQARIATYAKDQAHVTTSGMADFEAIAYSIAIPHEVRPRRMSNMFTSEPTAVANPWEVVDATFPTTPFATSAILPSTETFRFLFRDPLRATITPVAPPTLSGTSFYQVNCRTNGGDVSSNWYLTALEIQSIGKQNFLPGLSAFPTALNGTPSSYTPHGGTLYAGKSATAPGGYFPVTRSDVSGSGTSGWVIAPVGTIPAGTGYSVQVIPFRKTGQDVVFQGNMTNATTAAAPLVIPYGVVGGGATDISNFGYFTLAIVQTAGPIVDFNCTVYIQQSGIAFGQSAVPGLGANLAAAQTIRMSAIGVLMSNKAAPINRQGKVTSLQVPASVGIGAFLNSASVFDTVAKSQSALTKPCDKGRYSFLKPTQPADFDYFELNNVIAVNGASYPTSGFSLDNNHDYLVVAAQINTVAGQDLLWDVCFGVEYRTTDTWRDQAEPEVPPDAYSKALEFLKKLPQHYENPLHIGSILQMVRNAANKGAQLVMKYGPGVMSAAQRLEAFTR